LLHNEGLHIYNTIIYNVKLTMMKLTGNIARMGTDRSASKGFAKLGEGDHHKT
jgi:hypothetical protein